MSRPVIPKSPVIPAKAGIQRLRWRPDRRRKVLVEGRGSEHSPGVIAHCVALLVVLFTTMLSPITPPAWDTDSQQLCEGQLEQPWGALLGQADLELQDADDVERAPARLPSVPTFSFRLLASRAPFRSSPPHVVGCASLRDQRRSIRRLKTYAHVPRMDSDPSPS